MNPQIEGVTIVITGQFNPAIFQPAWLATNNLVRESEANTAEIGLIHPELTQLDTEWLRLHIARTRFEASTLQSAYVQPLRDLVLGIFRLLSHTPISAIGINQIFHYGMDGEELDQIAARFIRQDSWNQVLGDAKIRTLSMQSERVGSFPGITRLSMEPSTPLQEMGSFGLAININHHFQLDRDESQPANKLMQEVLNTQWMLVLDQGLAIADRILEQV